MNTKSIYTDGQYIKDNPNWHMEDSSWKLLKIIDCIQKHQLEFKTVAEVGCGAGEILNQLSIKMPDKIFKGYEISPQAFSLCEEKSKNNLSFSLSDILQKNEYFDILLCIDVFEHIENYIYFLKKLKNKAKYHLFHIPLDISISSVLRVSPILFARSKVGHIHSFTKETGLAVLQDSGYEIVDYFYTAGAVELNPKSWKTMLAKIPRQIIYTINPDFAVRLMGGYSLMVLTK
ncbi:MAG: methyltransferase domain-containing protein [Sphaerospermopsis sp. SIO1G1]|nr:methyltransferase domain-containing protein [Sphaerospermopsis sp. SIO1G1]